jgi:hypothetical protein
MQETLLHLNMDGKLAIADWGRLVIAALKHLNLIKEFQTTIHWQLF